MKYLIIAIGTNRALICYRVLIPFYSAPFWQILSKLWNLDWNKRIKFFSLHLIKIRWYEEKLELAVHEKYLYILSIKSVGRFHNTSKTFE